MEKRNTLLLTVVAIATLLVAVVGATFAYFAASTETDNTLGVTANTMGGSTFVATPGSPIALDITADVMQQSNTNNTTAAKSANSTLEVKLASPANDTTVSCTYDIVYYDTGDTFTTVKPEGYAHEFTLSGTDMTTLDYETIDATTRKVTVIDNAEITANTTAGTTKQYTFQADFYNVAAAQATGKHYAGYFAVENVVC